MGWIISVLTVFLMLCSCATRQRTISSRPPGLFGKDKNSELAVRGRPVGDAKRNPEIFVRQNDIEIEPAEPENTTGSLYRIEDERNNLFATAAPLNIGRFLTIHISSNRVGDGGKLALAVEEKKENSAPANSPAGEGDSAEKKEETEKELLAALPKLEPGDMSDARLIRFFKAKIVHRFDNGDAQILAQRRSSSEDEGNQIMVRARVPYEKLITGEDVLTSDLLSVHWVESQDGQMIERYSSGWEDEYTLRMSGFDEARSRLAINLDDQRKQLQEIKGRLESRIKSFGAERRSLAQQREEIFASNKKEQEKVKSLEDKLQEQKEKFEDVQEELLKLRPDEKPGDVRDGASGG